MRKRENWPLPKLSQRDERLRAHHGLTMKADGYYKSINGKTRYICKPMPLADAVALLDARIREIRGIPPGTVGPAKALPPGTLAIEGLAELYTTWLWQRLTTGVPKKLARRTYDGYLYVLNRFIRLVGPDRNADSLGEADFSLYATTYFAGISPNSVQREVTAIEAFANWVAPSNRSKGLIARAWFLGNDFRKPTREALAVQSGMKDKAYSPQQIVAAFGDIRRSAVMTAAAHLGLNCAFGPADVATLLEENVDLKAAVITFPRGRGKTGVARLCPLLPQTVEALEHYLAVRPKLCHASAAELFFRTSNGLPYARVMHKKGVGLTERNVGRAYDSLANRWHKITGRPFSGLRSTFAQLADDWTDQRAVDLVMGHSGNVAGTVRSRFYAKRVDPERIRPLCQHVWKLAFKVPIALPAHP